MARRVNGSPMRHHPGHTRRPPTGTLVSRLLRDTYAVPDDPVFWDRLEARIMSRIQGAPSWPVVDGWPAAFRAWARASVAAACAAALAAGVAAWASHSAEARVAYQSVLDGSTAGPVLSDSRFINVSVEEATERYVISH